MRVAGIDYSSHAVDIVTVPLDGDGPPDWWRIDLDGPDAFERTRCVASAGLSRSHTFWDDILAVGIEHPAGKHGTGPLMRIQGAILSCIPARMLVEPLPPAKWRKTVGLPGDASKEMVALRAYDHCYDNGPPGFEYLHWPQDACDALCIALATRQLLEHPEAA